MVLVNCDKREREYSEHLEAIGDWIHAVPFHASDELVGNLEETCNATLIPKISVFSVSKGFDKPVVSDIKHIILKNTDMGEAVNMVQQKIKEGEENFDKIDDEGVLSS